MFLKIISVRFMDINLVKYVINGANLVKIGHFWWKLSKSGHVGIVWGPKWRHMSKFWESGPIILSLKVSKNYFSQVYGQKCGQKCHWSGQFGPNNNNQNHGIGPPFRVGRKYFFLKLSQKLFNLVYWINWVFLICFNL